MNIQCKLLSLLIALPLLLVSCGEEVVNEYTSHQAYYHMDFQYGHTASGLYSALNSTNTFCIISIGGTGNAYTLHSELYGADAHDENITEEPLTRPSRVLGLQNGLIVGRSSFQDGALYVFDRQCPNCIKGGTLRFPLFFADAQGVKCATCQRTYGLLNGGVVTSGDGGEKLLRYHASYTAQVFQVANPQ